MHFYRDDAKIYADHSTKPAADMKKWMADEGDGKMGGDTQGFGYLMLLKRLPGFRKG